MRLWILSDIYRSAGTGEWTPPTIPNADVAVIAGNVGRGLIESIRWVATHIRPHMPVVMVAGNTDLLGGNLEHQFIEGRTEAAKLDINLLEQDSIEINGVLLAGCTLWTDFELDGAQHRDAAMNAARHMLPEHAQISVADGDIERPFTPEDAAELHRQSVDFLDRAWRREMPLVIVTHHAPSDWSLPLSYKGDPLNPAYASNIDDLVERLGAVCWVHGRIHACAEYRIGATTVICNARGPQDENADFNDTRVIDIPEPLFDGTRQASQLTAIFDDIQEDDRTQTVDEFLGLRRFGRSRRPAITSTSCLADAALRAALKPSDLRRIRKGGIALIVHVPGPDWVDPIKTACEGIADWSALFARSGSSRLEDRPDKGGQSAALELAHGRAVLGISHAPDRHLPAVLSSGADLRITVPTPSNAVIATVIQRVTGVRPRRLPPGLASSLSYDEICAAIRPGLASDCVRRLRSTRTARTVVDPTVSSAHPFETLAGFGEAHVWGLRLLSDLELVRQGKLAPSELSRHMVMSSAPGLGKSSFARSLARSAGLPLISSSVAAWFATSSGYLDGVIKAIDLTFNAARAYPDGAIILLDELDAVPARASLKDKDASWWTPVVTHLLLTIDALSDAERVCVIGATNYGDRIDPALVRPGRLDKVFIIEPPDGDALAEILRTHLGKELADLDLRPLAELGLGATGAQAVAWIKGARARARAAGRNICPADLLGEIAPPDNRQPDEIRRAAVHEAGHATAVTLLGVARVDQISLIARAGSGGMMHATSLAPTAQTRVQIEAIVVGLLAGRAAETAFFDEPSGGCGGPPYSDLAKATALLVNLHATLGLGDSLLYRGERSDIDRFMLDPALARTVDKDIKRLNLEAEQLVAANRDAVERLAKALIDKRIVDGREARSIISASSAELTALHSVEI